MTIVDWNEQLTIAMSIATTAHEGQTDKAGNAYILHPIAVANRVDSVEQKIVAILHDVVEDTYITFDFLYAKGFPSNIVEAVEALTRKKTETYAEFCNRASKNKLALEVKIADLQENLDITRFQNPSTEEMVQFLSRSKRYAKELEKLQRIKQHA